MKIEISKISNLLTNGFLKIINSDGSVTIDTTTYVSATNFKTAYDYDITGVRNNINTIFALPETYLAGSAKVFLNGLRLQKGAAYDYTETSSTEITFNYPIVATDLILIDYIKL